MILHISISAIDLPIHNINKGTNYSTIQIAIDDASPGDEIHMDTRTYVENVEVNKRVTLIGDAADVVTVRAADAEDHVFEVTADYVNISGFNIISTTGCWKAGIYLNNTNYCNISDIHALITIVAYY